MLTAQIPATNESFPLLDHLGLTFLDTGAALLFSILGIVVFTAAFILIDKLTPYDLWKELIEKQNNSLAMVVAGLGLGLCIIIASAIH